MSNTQRIISCIEKQSIGSIVDYEYFTKSIKANNISRASLRKTISRIAQKGMIKRLDEGKYKVLNNKRIRIFVYGSLMRNCINHKIIKDDATFLCTAKTVKKFAMFQANYGNFPRLVETDSKYAKHIHGEIYDLFSTDLLKKLDQFEGFEYTRKKIKIQTSDGNIQTVFVYVNQYARFPHNVPLLERWLEKKVTINKTAVIDNLRKKIAEERKIKSAS